jgi:hypothetical protein
VKRGSALDAPNSAVRLPQHPNQHRPKDPIFLAVDQELGEGAVSWGFPRTLRSGRLARSQGA